jgi:two-component system cell cycle response regulator
MFSTSPYEEDALHRIFIISERLIIFDGMEDVFEHIVKAAVSLTRADAATMRLLDFNKNTLEIVEGFGLSNNSISQPSISIGEGITGRVVMDGKPFITADVTKEPQCISEELANLEGIKSILSVPLRTKKGAVGCITAYRKNAELFGGTDLLLLNIFGSLAAEAIEKANLINELKQQSSHDELTGLYNKKMLLIAADECLLLSLRHSLKMSVIFIDIDDFKGFNDRHGHLLGDKLLCDFSRILVTTCRKSDSPGRFGGDEFVIIAPHTSKKGAMVLANKLRTIVANHKFAGKGRDKTDVTLSAGIASFPEDGDNISELIREADEAMYESKKAGKNKVTAWPLNLACD